MTTNRLEFFRQQIAAFEPSSDPKEAIEKGYYIEQPRNSLANTIATKMALRPSSRHLLIGGIGSGKTTQLLMTCDKLNQIEDISAHYIDVSLYTDISEIQPGSLLAITGLVLSNLYNPANLNDDTVGENNDEYSEQDFLIYELEEAISLINKYAYGFEESKRFEIGFDDIKQYEGVLSIESKKQKEYKEIYDSIKKIKDYINEKNQWFILLFDGLDRFNNDQSMLSIIDLDVELISQLGIGIICVGSIYLYYSSYQYIIRQKFNNNIYYQPYFDIDDDRNACNFFEKILNKRSSQNFISNSAKAMLISYSGGILRDLINLTQNSIEEAYLKDSDIIKESHVNAAVEAYGQTKVFGISDSELEILIKVAQREAFLPRTDEHINLLINQKILEYRYPRKRYTVHPVLLPYLVQLLA